MMRFSDGQNYVSTSHEAGTEPGSTRILSDRSLNLRNMNLMEHVHSHPGGINIPSGLPPAITSINRDGDIQFSKGVERAFPLQNTYFSIYTPSDGKYTPYTSRSTSPAMPEVIITAPRRKKNN